MTGRLNISLLAVLPLLLFPCYSVNAQFLTIEINVEPEISATVEQSLDFGRISTNAGLVQFNLGNPSMGIFSIRALRSQRLLITVETPEALRHEVMEATLPVNIELAVANAGENNWRMADVVTEYPAEVVIHPPAGQPDSDWSFAWLYVYGSINVGNIPTGIYTGDVVLNVEYD